MNTQEVTDMVGKIREFGEFVSNTLVNASALAQQVQDLTVQVQATQSSFQGQIDQMQRELDALRNTNAQLTEDIGHIREERNAAQAEATQLRNELAVVTHDREGYQSIVEQHAQRINELQEQLTDSRKAHDDAEYRAMHWEEQHNAVKAKLDKIHAALGVVQQEQTPQPEPHPVQAVSNW